MKFSSKDIILKYFQDYFEEIEEIIAEAIEKILRKEVEEIIIEVIEIILKEKFDFFVKEVEKVAKPGEKGEPGLPGKDIDEDLVIKKVLAKIPKPKEIKLEAKEIRDKLQSLKEDEKLDTSAIKGLVAFIRTYISHLGGKGGGGGDTIRYIDISSQLDGSTKVFTLTRVNRILGVFGSSFPGGGFRPETDWTFAQSTGKLTFTDEINASTTLALGQTIWIMYVES